MNKYNLITIGITKDGKWRKFNGVTEDIINDTWNKDENCVDAFISPCRDIKGIIEINNSECKSIKVDVAFPILHGKYGEDGIIQGMLELAGIPFIGCDTLSSSICMDKEIAHSLVAKSGVKVAKSGSSIGITKVRSFDELEDAINKAFIQDNKFVMEEAIEGFEVGCAVLGNENPIVGEIDEIELTGDFFDFNEKCSLATSKIHMLARVDKEIYIKVKETALKIYKVLSCKGMSRVDMLLTPQNEIYFNEVNTIPGFTDNSRYPKVISSLGLNYRELIDKLIDLAMDEDKYA